MCQWRVFRVGRLHHRPVQKQKEVTCTLRSATCSHMSNSETRKKIVGSDNHIGALVRPHNALELDELAHFRGMSC